MLKDKNILIMGLLDTQSLAWAIGQAAGAAGGRVTYTVQSERFRDVLLRRSFAKQGLNLDDYHIVPCDVVKDQEIEGLFQSLSHPIDGLVHSIAYANPKTCLANSIFVAPRQDILQAFEISAASLALVLASGQRKLNKGASVVALTFNTLTTFPGYDWMGVCKAALEAIARYAARDLGPSQIRVNCVSAGPLLTKAAANIPGFERIRENWSDSATLGWNPESDHLAVADTVLYLLGDGSRRVTGEVIYVDGGYHAHRGITAPR